MNFLKQNSKKLILLAIIVVIGLFSVQYMESSEDATGALKWRSTKNLSRASIAINSTPLESTLQKGLNRIKFRTKQPLTKDTKLSVMIDSDDIDFEYDKTIKIRRNKTSFSYDFKISESVYNSINEPIAVKITTNDPNSLVFPNQRKGIKFSFAKPEQPSEHGLEEQEVSLPQIAPSQNNEDQEAEEIIINIQNNQVEDLTEEELEELLEELEKRNRENQEPQEQSNERDQEQSPDSNNQLNNQLQIAPVESTNQEPQEQSNERDQEQSQDSNNQMNYQLQAAPVESTNQEPQEQSNERDQEQSQPTPQYNPDSQYPMPEEQSQDTEDQEPEEININYQNTQVEDLTEEELEELLEELEEINKKKN